ncbi:MAG: hypothetical protein AB3N18_11725 [Allomuricauda sp.]
MSGVKHKETSQIQEALIRLERNHNTVKSFTKKLNSYTCEPNNSSCFEKFYDLKRNFQVFNVHQNRISALIKEKTMHFEMLDKEIKMQLKRFKQLEADIASYLLDTNKHF